MTKDPFEESIAKALAAPEPALEALDLAGAVRAAAEKEPIAPPRRWIRWAGALAAAASVVIAVGLAEFRDGVRAKGSGADGSGARWAGARLFRVEGNAAPVKLDATIGRSDGVLVSYSNTGPRPYSHLMVYAVDARGQIAWLYPAWQRAEDDPESIAIAIGERVELRERIKPSWAAGPAVIHALFLREPHRVREIEAQIARGAIAIPDSMAQRFEVTVVP